MTNIIGLTLLVLNVHTQEVVATNYAGQSCEAAGCTNWQWCEVEVQDKAAVYDPLYPQYIVTNGHLQYQTSVQVSPAVTHKERRKMCITWHYRPYTWTNAVIVTTAVGTKDGPLFDVVDVKSFNDSGRGLRPRMEFYNDGVFLQRHKETP